jgi:outer membrane biosynthesis protein TonB
MARRNAVAISITFHAVLLTALALYLTIWDRPVQPPDLPPAEPGPIVVEHWPQEDPPRQEEEDPPPPVRDNLAENVPDDETLPFPPNDTKEFDGSVIEEALFNPPPESPTPTVKVQPVYPADCLEDGESGEVEAVLKINADGHVVAIEITSATKPCFAREASKALKKWRYGKQAVREISTNSERTAIVQIVFNIEDVKRHR